ncbi:MAG: hypothetical protein R2705_21310 [Ilumatobacteraceae bacterium]
MTPADLETVCDNFPELVLLVMTGPNFDSSKAWCGAAPEWIRFSPLGEDEDEFVAFLRRERAVRREWELGLEALDDLPDARGTA